MATDKTNIFNALTGLSQSMQLRLVTMALDGDSPVSNGLTDMVEREGLSPKSRAQKERERERSFREFIRITEQQQEQFQEQLRRMDQATSEALLENEEKLQVAKKDLELIRSRAYEITMPDGTTEKVYRDGDKVRTDAGKEVDPGILRAEDIPPSAPTWEQRKAAGEAVERLTKEHSEIVEYQEKLANANKALSSGDLSPEEMEKLEADVADMPDAVRNHYDAQAGRADKRASADAVVKPATFESGVSPLRDFSAVVAGLPTPAAATDPDRDFKALPPAALPSASK